MDQTLKINGDELFMKTNVLNITFAGIESDLLTMMVGTPLEGAIQMPFDKFGWFYDVSTVCPRSLDPLYSVNYHIHWVKTYWTYNILTLKRLTSYLMAI